MISLRICVIGWLLLVTTGCGDGIGFLTAGPGASGVPGETTSATTGAPTTSDENDVNDAADAPSSDSTHATDGADSGAPACDPGDIGCTCIGYYCRTGGKCWLEECVPFTGACDRELDGVCAEGTTCLPGTDPYDCCATPQDGICEEHSGGGPCAKGSDLWDCGYCPYVKNGVCDVQCPPGTDEFDCCATPRDGVCEEPSHGGACPDGSDFYDCGYCPYTNDFSCEEPLLCPPGSDKPDCCAIVQDGVCEEPSHGGACPFGSDPYDCGYCLGVQDGFCDEVDCPPGTDLFDCCATPEDGVCEEVGMGGACPAGSDYYDCGYCLLIDDGWCDDPGLCPPGTDANDCCALPENGVCEEVGMGGACSAGSDYYDCGYCLLIDDGWCDDPGLCPPGTDASDCCGIPKNGVCEEMGMGGACAPGSDYYDCGHCLSLDDGHCDEPLDCPPGSDSGDCP